MVGAKSCASMNFQQAIESKTDAVSSLEGTENRIAVARRDYIDAVRAFNTEIRTFPSIIWAKTVFGSKPMAEFAADESAQTPPQVKF